MMKKLSMPINFISINEGNKGEYLYWLKKCKADRVFLCGLGNIYQPTSFLKTNTQTVKNVISYFKQNGVEVGVWVDGFGHGSTLFGADGENSKVYTQIEGVDGKTSEHAFCPEDEEFANDYKDAIKLLNARVNNLESNLHIEIDMERIEDRSKALSYIGIEVADALKTIPTPVEKVAKVEEVKQEEVETIITDEKIKTVPVQEQVQAQTEEQYIEETTFEAKPSLWQRIKNSKVVRAIKYAMKIRVVLDYPALPEGRGENY